MAITLIAITALLGLGALTVLSVQTELASSGQSRFTASALYAAESGTAAGMDFLRQNCSISDLFSAWVSPNNANPPKPSGIVGNGARPGEYGNPFDTGPVPNLDLWYEVSILNNIGDPHTTGTGGSSIYLEDSDGIVILHSVGHGPDQTVAIVDLEIQPDSCVAKFCAKDYAQRGVTSLNDAFAACSPRVGATGMRQFTP